MLALLASLAWLAWGVFSRCFWHPSLFALPLINIFLGLESRASLYAQSLTLLVTEGCWELSWELNGGLWELSLELTGGLWELTGGLWELSWELTGGLWELSWELT
jgi:hypothetical protein